MPERIKDIISKVENNATSTQEQKNKAQEVLKILTLKGKNELHVQADASKEVKALLEEITLGAGITAELIEGSLQKPSEIVNTTSDTDTTTESEDDSEDNGDKMAEKLGREGWDKAYIVAKMYSRGYVPAHSMSFQKDFSGKKIQWLWNNSRYLAVGGPLTKGELKEGVYETRMTKINDGMKKLFASHAISEETQLRSLLKATIENSGKSIDKTKVQEKLRALNEFKAAINSGNKNAIKTAAANYASISEKTGKTKGLFKNAEVSQTVKSDLDKSKDWREKNKREELEEDSTNQRKEISTKIKGEIEKQEAEIKKLQESNEKDKQNLKNEKVNLDEQKVKLDGELDDFKNDKQKLVDEKVNLERKNIEITNTLTTKNTALLNSNTSITTFEKQKSDGVLEIGRIDATLIEKADNKELVVELNKQKTAQIDRNNEIETKLAQEKLNQEKINAEITGLTENKNKLDLEISENKTKLENIETKLKEKQTEIRNKDSEIRQKQRAIDDFKPTNTSEIEKAEGLKKFYTELASANKVLGHEEAKSLLQEYKSKYKSPLKLSPHKNYEAFLVTDQKTKIDTEVKAAGKRGQNGEGKKEFKNASNKAIDKEVASIDKEVKEIEKRLEDLRKDALDKLTKLDDKAKRDPSKVPEMRADIEGTVEKMNAEIRLLEAKGISSLKELSIDELRLLSTRSKWTEGIVKANGGLDKLMAGKTGKVVGVGAIALLAKGVTDGDKETWKLATADIALGMIPIFGGAYDLWMAQVKGTDLNGNKIEGQEKWVRTGFGIIGLVPGVGTLVKMAVTAKKGANLVEVTKAVQKADAVIETTQLTGKVAGIGMLGYGGYTTVTYYIDELRKKI